MQSEFGVFCEACQKHIVLCDECKAALFNDGMGSHQVFDDGVIAHFCSVECEEGFFQRSDFSPEHNGHGSSHGWFMSERNPIGL